MTLRTGDAAPYEVVIDLTPEEDVDLSVVTSAVLKVKRPNGTFTDWSAVISNQTATTLRVTHVLQAGDLQLAGFYSLVAVLTVPSGSLRSEARSLEVKDLYAVP